jgi:hypothetical protein
MGCQYLFDQDCLVVYSSTNIRRYELQHVKRKLGLVTFRNISMLASPASNETILLAENHDT